MCFRSKQKITAVIGLCVGAFTLAPAFAQETRGSAGAVAVGDGAAGVTDKIFVAAPPNYRFVVQRAPGSFLDCGAGQDARTADADGRDAPPLYCAVTLTETMVIPAAAASATVIVHF